MKFRFLSAIAALAVLATGCTNDGTEVETGNGDKSMVSLTITTQVDANDLTRAGEAGGQEATTNESAIAVADGVDVVVFNTAGSCIYASHHGLEEIVETPADIPGTYKTAEVLEIVSGNHFFFVYANNGDGVITLPAVGSHIDAFMNKATAGLYTGAALNIVGNGEFLLGSGWRESTTVGAGGTTATPVVVTIPNIGRLSSKVSVADFDVLTASDEGVLLGSFEMGQYRIGTAAKTINQAGVHTATVWDAAHLPVGSLATNQGVLVTSAKHVTPFELTSGAGDFNTTDYVQYLDWVVANGTDTPAIYVTENTTARDEATSLQYFGNTTYVQIETVYAPALEDLVDVNLDAFTGAVPSTFWTGVVAGQRYIFGEDPSAVAGLTEFKQYTDGKNWHKFVIYDPNETDGVIKNRVLRNHYYGYTITSILDLGDNTSDVDPTEPVTENTTLDLRVNVGNWDKVTDGVEL